MNAARSRRGRLLRQVLEEEALVETTTLEGKFYHHTRLCLFLNVRMQLKMVSCRVCRFLEPWERADTMKRARQRDNPLENKRSADNYGVVLRYRFP